MRKNLSRERSCYCIKLRRATNTLTKYYDQALAPVGLTLSQYSLLNDIRYLQSCNKSELAQCANLDRTTVIRNLAMLRERGLVRETPGPDKRNNLIELTELGQSLINEARVPWEQAQKRLRELVGEDGMERFSQVLAIIDSPDLFRE